MWGVAYFPANINLQTNMISNTTKKNFNYDSFLSSIMLLSSSGIVASSICICLNHLQCCLGIHMFCFSHNTIANTSTIHSFSAFVKLLHRRCYVNRKICLICLANVANFIILQHFPGRLEQNLKNIP